MILPATTDCLVIGGGIMGIAMALELKRRYADQRITLIEKETALGQHASGRNSGVLHAGFYYTADSLKARFTRDGNRRLTDYCLDRGIHLNRCGKLVVAQDARDLPQLDELVRRGRANGVALEEVDEQAAHDIEPRARTCERALFSPATASVAPGDVIESLQRDLLAAGVVVAPGVAYLAARGRVVDTTAGAIDCGYVVNAAGLYADRIARDWGFSERYCVLPFKGLYLYLSPQAPPLRVHVYPVPDLRNPFLGVHFTITADGRAKIGPTAIPALWREHYHGLDHFRPNEFLEIACLQSGLFARNDFGFRDLAFAEVRKYSKPYMVASARRLAAIDAGTTALWGKPGIRAQLFDREARRLEMDFVHEGDDRSFHVLNAVSPAFTCSLPFSEFLVARIAELLG